jgi:oligopeptide transport system ATP-binding protein
MANQETNQPLVQVNNLCKYFHISRKETLKAVDDVTFHINKGETVSLVGESGCGKSTTGRCMIRLYNPTKGEVIYNGKNIMKLSGAEKKEFCKKVQMIFQNPYSSLNPRMTVKEIVGEGLKQHGMSQKEADAKVEKLLETVGLNKDHMSRFPHEFSGGQRQRIGIARALSVDPEFIICDEPISALDVSIQAQVINMLKNLQETMGLTYLFIAHDLSVVKYISDRVVVMYLGTIVETAETEELFSNTQHPYTKALLSAIPEADPKKAKANERIPIKGEIPSPINPKNCCRFAERCEFATDRCFGVMPKLKEVAPGHMVACHLV